MSVPWFLERGGYDHFTLLVAPDPASAGCGRRVYETVPEACRHSDGEPLVGQYTALIGPLRQVSIPKAGTTWVNKILYLLLRTDTEGVLPEFDGPDIGANGQIYPDWLPVPPDRSLLSAALLVVSHASWLCASVDGCKLISGIRLLHSTDSILLLTQCSLLSSFSMSIAPALSASLVCCSYVLSYCILNSCTLNSCTLNSCTLNSCTLNSCTRSLWILGTAGGQ